METGENSKLAFSHIDSRYNPANCNHYLLSLQIGKNQIIGAVLDTDINTFIAIEKHLLPLNRKWQQLTPLVTQIIHNSSVFNQTYQITNINVVNRYCTLIPKSLFVKDKEAHYLTILFGECKNLTILSDKIVSASCNNVFSIYPSLHSDLINIYPNAKFTHYTTPFIENALRLQKSGKDIAVYVNLGSEMIDLLVIVNGELQFLNSFKQETPEDVLYYLLYSCEQLKINTEKAKFYIQGDEKIISNCNDLFNTYLTSFQLSKRNDEYEYASCFSKIKTEEYATLLNPYLCV